MKARHVRFALATILLSLPAYSQWVLTSGPYGGTVSCLAIAEGDLYAGTFGGGVFVSGDNGTTWGQTGLTNTNVYALTAIPDGKGGTTVLAGTHDGLMYSTDGGSSWDRTGPANTYVYSFAAMPGDSGTRTIFGGTHGDGVLLSTDGGMSWLPAGLGGAWVRCMLVCGGDLFAGTAGNGIFHSTDRGTSWTPAGTPLPAGTSVNALAMCPDGNGDTSFFAGTYGSGVLKSTDRGETWFALNFGLADWCVYALVVCGTNVFTGTESHGVFLLLESETPWVSVNKGLADTNVYALAANETHLFAGTFWAGVWRRPLGEFTSAADAVAGTVPNAFCLYQNYPNPFNSSTLIRYSVPGGKEYGEGGRGVRLVVYDVIGREVAVLLNGRKAPGRYEVKFDGSTLASGIYLYRLSAGNFVETKKLLFLK